MTGPTLAAVRAVGSPVPWRRILVVAAIAVLGIEAYVAGPRPR